MQSEKKIINSMLWAAYGDALGFITELGSSNTIKYRTGGISKVTGLIPWKRKIGGRYGVTIELPQGCYSDDTQLRLAVCRSMKKDGKFDFETFAKIELPVFLAYGLGKGRGTRAAAESLKKKSIQWNTNIFKQKEIEYINMGGNGAAMRIQPHVWIGFDTFSEEELISEIMRNSIITHGSPVAWLGAVFHGLVLQYALINNECPSPDKWLNILDKSKRLVEVCKNDNMLNQMWLPTWERISKVKIEDAVEKAAVDMLNDTNIILEIVNKNSLEKINDVELEKLYHTAVKSIDALNPNVSGSGIKTALLSSFIGYCYSHDPIEGLIVCCNNLGSDTDTIGTLAGSLFGTLTQSHPPQKILDHDYLILSAEQLLKIRDNQIITQFSYPDLLNWKLPNSNLDLTGTNNNKMVLYGLGEVYPEEEKMIQKQRNMVSTWRFVRTSFGQTLLLNHRENLKNVSSEALPIKLSEGNAVKKTEETYKNSSVLKGNNAPLSYDKKQGELFSHAKSIDEITDTIIKQGFKISEIGKELLRFAEEQDGIEKAISFASIIVKAKMARIQRDKKTSK